jgi:glycosyltransferase involved in cell wall biosynthesis
MKFLINTITKWDEPPRARHQVAQALSKKYPVHFISANKTGWPRIKKRQIKKNLQIIIPYFPVPFKLRYRLPVINEIYQIWLFSKISDEFKNHSVINFDFSSKLIYKYFSKVIFYCNDNFSEISQKINPKFIAEYHKNCEKYIAENADFCIATSKIIKNNLVAYNRNSYEIKLGGPNTRDFNIDINYNINKSDKINVGLVGYIRDFNLSHNILNNLVSNTSIYLTLIGPIEKQFIKKLNNTDQIKILGIHTGTDLLKEVNKFDVAIAPYNSDRLNEGCFPNKIWIYMAMGKPVVASDLASLQNVSFPEKSVYIAKTYDNFLNLILKAHNENDPDLIKKRINFAKDNSWDNRMEDFIKIYNKFFR